MNTALLEILLMAEAIERGTEPTLHIGIDHGVGPDRQPAIRLRDEGGVIVVEERFADIHLPTPKVDRFGSWWGRPDVLSVRRAAFPPPPEKPLTGPISRVCPRCGAAVGKGCNREGNYRLSRKHRFHKSRMDK